jgi:hypothetical protein
MSVPYREFGPLYHGTPNEIDDGVIDVNRSGDHYADTGMGVGGPRVFVTPHFLEAKSHAGPEGAVHEVVPHPEGSDEYDVDPNSGGWRGRAVSKEEALRVHREAPWRGVGLMFRDSMISKRQFSMANKEHP